MGTLFELENVSYSYVAHQNEVSVLQNYSLQVNEGDFIAIMGPSGSGKSTVLALLAGLITPQEGRVLFKGQDLASYTEAEQAHYLNKHLGMVYQFFNLVPNMTALDNVALPGVIGGSKLVQARTKAKGLLEAVGLADKEKKKAGKLSGGQQQRVAIARAFMNDPQAILADEPTGSLDRVTSTTIMDLLVEQKNTHGSTLVVVTHDREVAEMADKIIEF
jgi:ABC-type lipoprotein export system ATPase subunit